MDDSHEHAAYAGHLRAEHRRLDHAILRVQREWLTIDQTSPSPDRIAYLSDSLTLIREELDKHFRDEEEGGCLAEAVCRCPNLSQEADRIKGEHFPLLTQLDAMILHLRRARQSGGANEALRQEFSTWAEALHAHEEAENAMLENAFGIPVE